MAEVEGNAVEAVPLADKMLEGSHGKERGVEIEEAGVVAEVEEPKDPGRAPEPVCDGFGDERQEQNAVVERKDTQGATHVEDAKAMGGVASVVEDAGDKEARENEEDIDASPAPVELGLEGSEVVLDEDHENGDGAKAI